MTRIINVPATTCRKIFTISGRTTGEPCLAHSAILGWVHPLSWDELADRWADVETAVDATPGVDPWCSGPDWQLPVAVGYAPDAPRLLLATESGDGFALLSRYRDVDGAELISGLEPLWGFGCPLLGADPGAVAGHVARALDRDPSWDHLVLPGLPPVQGLEGADDDPGLVMAGHGEGRGGHGEGRGGQRTTLPVAMALSSLGRVGFAEGITRQLIDLGDGFDAWLDRRSPKFRRNLRRAERRAAEVGLTIVDADPGDTDPTSPGQRSPGQGDTDPTEVDALLDRLLAIEERSWKGREGNGMIGPGMATMYRAMLTRLRTRGRLLAHVAVVDGDDVGFIIGGIRNRRYRGLQLSYVQPDDQAGAEDLSIGNLLQAHHLRLLVERDLADVYDLGMDIDYKRRWADRAERSIVLVAQR